ncbi:MAG TPA: HAD family hydrolase [Chloroflexota bacterium]|nr:HAD family hydrolase [Chloroflexota bacterium]
MARCAALLDVDGTLVDSNYEHVQAWNQAFRQHGFVLPEAWIHRAIGMGGDKLVPHLLQTAEDDPRVTILGDLHDRIFRQQYIDGIQPLPGTAAFFDRLAAEHYLSVLATSAKPDELEQYVRLLGLEGRLAATVSKRDVHHTKPAPEIFAVACDKLGMAPAQVIVVGDSVWDVKAALRIGARCVGLCTGGFDREELRREGAAAVYDDLPTLLEQWQDSPFTRA